VGEKKDVAWKDLIPAFDPFITELFLKSLFQIKKMFLFMERTETGYN